MEGRRGHIGAAEANPRLPERQRTAPAISYAAPSGGPRRTGSSKDCLVATTYQNFLKRVLGTREGALALALYTSKSFVSFNMTAPAPITQLSPTET